MNDCMHVYGCDQPSVRQVLMPSFHIGWTKESFCEVHACLAEDMKKKLGVGL